MATKHGFAAHGTRPPEYTVWQGMIARCHRPNSENYARYGGRGVTVCDRWRYSFPAFLADMGWRPGPGYSIDRKNGALGYTPENCRWATLVEQARNHSSNVIVEVAGRKVCAAEASEMFGLPRETVAKRIKRGLSGDALFAPFPVYPDVCTVPGCEKKHIAKGFCTKHYQSNRKAMAKETA